MGPIDPNFGGSRISDMDHRILQIVDHTCVITKMLDVVDHNGKSVNICENRAIMRDAVFANIFIGKYIASMMILLVGNGLPKK